MSNFGIRDEKVDEILDKYNIKKGEPIALDNVKAALKEVISENNKSIEKYLSSEYPKHVEKQLELIIKRRR